MEFRSFLAVCSIYGFKVFFQQILRGFSRGFCRVVHMSQVAGSGFFAKVASRLIPGEGVGLVSEDGKHDF